MKKVTIGYIFTGREGHEEKAFRKLTEKENIGLTFFNVSDEIIEEELKKRAEKCDVIFNNSAGPLAVEMVKTFEEMGKKVIDASKVYYYTEDKWMFFLKCKKHNIPTPETTLLPIQISAIKKSLKKFNKWPVILKRTEGEQGEFVQKAENIREAVKTIEKFWEKEGIERLPIIAQEFINSKTYRVTVIDGKIVQTALKDGHGWKATAVYAEKVDKFTPDKELKSLIKKLMRVINIKICGVDLMKKDNQWLVIEVNAEPSFEFFEDETEALVKKVITFLVKKM